MCHTLDGQESHRGLKVPLPTTLGHWVAHLTWQKKASWFLLSRFTKETIRTKFWIVSLNPRKERLFPCQGHQLAAVKDWSSHGQGALSPGDEIALISSVVMYEIRPRPLPPIAAGHPRVLIAFCQIRDSSEIDDPHVIYLHHYVMARRVLGDCWLTRLLLLNCGIRSLPTTAITAVPLNYGHQRTDAWTMLRRLQKSP